MGHRTVSISCIPLWRAAVFAGLRKGRLERQRYRVTVLGKGVREDKSTEGRLVSVGLKGLNPHQQLSYRRVKACWVRSVPRGCDVEPKGSSSPLRRGERGGRGRGRGGGARTRRGALGASIKRARDHEQLRHWWSHRPEVLLRAWQLCCEEQVIDLGQGRGQGRREPGRQAGNGHQIKGGA